MRRTMLAFAAAPARMVVLLAACGGAASSSTGGSGAAQAEAKQVDIGNGLMIWIECQGTGAPTIILESGIHDASDYWSVDQLIPPAADPPVMQGLAETNRVCRYDRPGTIVPGDPPKITDRSTPVASRGPSAMSSRSPSPARRR